MSGEVCESVAPLLVDYADGDLPETDRPRVETHLAECLRCREELARLDRSLEIARTIWEEAAEVSGASMPACGAGVPPASVMQPGRPHHKQKSGERRRLAIAGISAACAAAVLLALGAWLFSQRDDNHLASREEVAPSKTTNANAQPSPPRVVPQEKDDIEAIIAREGRAARLAATIDLLATQPSLKDYKEEAQRYLKEVYPDTTSASRIEAHEKAKPGKDS